MVGRVRLTVVENPTPGFFDPISLGSEVHIALKETKDGMPRTAEAVGLATAKARSNRVHRAGKSVIAQYISKNPHVTEDMLVRKTTKNHPKCMHPVLLGAMVKTLYPGGCVYVDDNDAAWILGRAPELPRPSSATTVRNEDAKTTQEGQDVCGEDGGDACGSADVVSSCGDNGSVITRADMCPSDDRDGDDVILRANISPSDDRDGDDVILRADFGPSGDRDIRSRDDKSQRWYTDTSLDEWQSDFPEGAPWEARVRHRIVRCKLPNDIMLNIDPLSGLVRASDITAHFDKRMTYWLHLGMTSNDNDGTRGLAYALANELETTPAKLVYAVTSAPKSTWVHIKMVVNLASWCSPAFSLHVSNVVVRYHSGELTTAESEEAARSVQESMRPEATQSSAVAQPPVPTKSPQHRLVRARARQSSVRAPQVHDIAIPRHLLNTTGIYIGVFGLVSEEGFSSFWHLKIGKACEQPVTSRIKDHYAEHPYTFVLLYMAGCDGSLCHIAEAALKHICSKVLRLPRVGSSEEEFKVNLDMLDQTLEELTSELNRRHGDILNRPEDVPESDNLAKYRIDKEKEAELEFKRYAFDQILKNGDAAARERAIASILGHV